MKQESSRPDDGTTTEPLPPQASLVEDVLLLLFQPSSGMIAGENILFYVLGGAVVGDLALTESVQSERSGLFSRPVHVVPGRRPDDELLSPTWDYLAEKPRGVQTVLAAMGPPLRGLVLDRLVSRGDLRRERRKMLGLFTSTHYSLASPRREMLMTRVRASLVDGAAPDPRTAATIALLSASDTLPQFHPEIPWSSDVYTRGKEFEKGDWGAAAAASAVTRTMTAVISGGLAASIASIIRS